MEGMYTQARTYYQESLSLAHAMRYRKAIALTVEAFAALLASEHAGENTRENTKENTKEERFAPTGDRLADGHSPQAALLWGAADALRREIRSPIPPGDRPAYERAIAETRKSMGEEAFHRAWEAGQTMSLEQAIAEILITHPPAT